MVIAIRASSSANAVSQRAQTSSVWIDIPDNTGRDGINIPAVREADGKPTGRTSGANELLCHETRGWRRSHLVLIRLDGVRRPTRTRVRRVRGSCGLRGRRAHRGPDRHRRRFAPTSCVSSRDTTDRDRRLSRGVAHRPSPQHSLPRRTRGGVLPAEDAPRSGPSVARRGHTGRTRASGFAPGNAGSPASTSPVPHR